MQPLTEYLEALASDRPTPGGGSAALLVAATGSALVAMVARICARNPKYAAHAPLLERTVAAADALRLDLLAGRAADERAFEAVGQAQSLPKNSENATRERAAALEAALRSAAQEPLQAACKTLGILHACVDLLTVPNRNLASDVGCAAEFASAAIASSAYNVRINHRFMRDAATIAEQSATLERCEREAADLLTQVRAQVEDALRKPA